MLAPRLVANLDRRGHTEICSEAWGGQQPVGLGLEAKKGWRQRLWTCGAAWAGTKPGDTEISGMVQEERYVTVQTLHRTGGQEPSHASPP